MRTLLQLFPFISNTIAKLKTGTWVSQLLKAVQPLRGTELHDKEEQKDGKDIGKLFRKSSPKNVSINSRFKVI